MESQALGNQLYDTLFLDRILDTLNKFLSITANELPYSTTKTKVCIDKAVTEISSRSRFLTLLNQNITNSDCSKTLTCPRKTLESWAEGKKLILGSFFFKLSTDNQDQKSITGLLRSLLHQLLSEHPPFIEYIDPVMRSAKKIWSDKSLRSALRAIARECERENVKMCIFLDGLDEFENVEGLENFESHGVEQQPLVDLIEELVQGDCIKAIVSSREETLFVTRFSGYKQLCLQNLTFEDIQSYVKARLLQEQAMVIWKVGIDPIIIFGVSNIIFLEA